MNESKDSQVSQNLNKSGESLEVSNEPVPSEVIRKLAEIKPDAFMEMMEMSSIGNPLHNKMTPEHITQVLDLAAKHDERLYDLRKCSLNQDYDSNVSDRRYYFAGFVTIVILLVVVMLIFRAEPNILIPIISGIGGLFAGFVAGFGFGKTKSK
jgi:hypothetical protein